MKLLKLSRRGVIRTIVVGLPLFIALLVGGFLWVTYGNCTGLPKRLFHRYVFADGDFIGKNTRFRVWAQGSGGTPEGYDRDFTQLRASDCVAVTFETESMSSQAEAESELKKKISIAFRVVEHGFKADIPEHPDGERAVLLFDNGARTEIVLWFKGERWLHIIESKSLAHALACEKLIQGGYRIDSRGYVVASGQLAPD